MEQDDMVIDELKRAGERYYRPDREECGEAASAYIAALEARLAMLIRADAVTTLATMCLLR